jgi:hypothetical protein
MAIQKVNNVDLKVGDTIKAEMKRLAGINYNPPLEYTAKVVIPNDDFSTVEKNTVLVKMVNQPKDFPVNFGVNGFRIYTNSIVEVL